MSTIRVNTLQNTSTTDGGISINASGHVTVDGVAMPSSGPLSNRNLVINGAMQVAQRGTSISLTQAGAYTLDRFVYQTNALDTYTCTVAKSSTAPAGFTSSLQLTTGTAESLDANEYILITQKIEAQNLQHLQFGTALAQDITLSFWVRSSQTGTFGINLYQDDGNDIVNSTYTISTADTWEHKAITFPGNTAASPANDNGTGLRINWVLGVGTNYSGTSQPTWADFTDNGAWGGDHAQNGVVTNASATWYITGVQLEVGSVATPFEHRSYGDELRRCQRYYVRRYGADHPTAAVVSPFMIAYNTTSMQGSAILPVEMRASPTLNKDGTFRAEDGVNAYSSTGAFVGQQATTYGANFWLGGFTGLTQYRGYYTGMDGTTSWFDFSAEL